MKEENLQRKYRKEKLGYLIRGSIIFTEVLEGSVNDFVKRSIGRIKHIDEEKTGI